METIKNDQNLLQTQKAGNNILRNTTSQGTLSFLSYLLFPCISQYYGKNDNTERKGKTRKPTVSFPFNPSLFISNSRVENGGRTCVYQEAR